MPPIPGDDLGPLINAASGQINTSADPYKLLRALNSTILTNKDYNNGGGSNNVIFGEGAPSEGVPGEWGSGWGNTVNYEPSPAHQGLGTGVVVGIVTAVSLVLVAGGVIAIVRYRKRHAKHGGGGIGGGSGGAGLIEKWRAKLLGLKGNEEKAGSEIGTVAPAPDHYASRSRSRGRSTYG